MKRIDIIRYGFYFFMGASVLFLLYNTFHSRPSPVDPKEVIAAKNETIEILKKQAAIDSTRYEASIKAEQDRDSILVSVFNANQQKYKPLNQKYEAIPSIVRNLSKDSLRSAIGQY